MEQVRLAVEADPRLARRNLQFEHRGRRVTVQGTVESYYQKQLAQETLRRIDGIDEIENHLSVCWSAEQDSGSPNQCDAPVSCRTCDRHEAPAAPTKATGPFQRNCPDHRQDQSFP
jgi:hypothetical protein